MLRIKLYRKKFIKKTNNGRVHIFFNREMAWFDYCYRHHLQLEGPIYIIANNKLCCRTEWFFKAFTPFNRETKLSNAHLILFVFSWSVVFWGSSFLPLAYIKLNRKLNGFMLNQNKSSHRFFVHCEDELFFDLKNEYAWLLCFGFP